LKNENKEALFRKAKKKSGINEEACFKKEGKFKKQKKGDRISKNFLP